MKKIIYIFLKVILALLIGVSTGYEYMSNDIITVSIYYSSYSPASRSFIINQLYPAYMKLGQYLKLDFLPYGVTNITFDTRGSYIFECTRGADDCYGNIIQSCALNQTDDDSVKLNFVYCFMTNSRNSNATDVCTNETQLDKNLIRICRREHGQDMLVHFGERTRQELPEKYNLPKVKLDGKFIQFGKGNFFDNLCEVLKGVPECQNRSRRRYIRDISHNPDDEISERSGDIENEPLKKKQRLQENSKLKDERQNIGNHKNRRLNERRNLEKNGTIDNLEKKSHKHHHNKNIEGDTIPQGVENNHNRYKNKPMEKQKDDFGTKTTKGSYDIIGEDHRHHANFKHGKTHNQNKNDLKLSNNNKNKNDSVNAGEENIARQKFETQKNKHNHDQMQEPNKNESYVGSITVDSDNDSGEKVENIEIQDANRNPGTEDQDMFKEENISLEVVKETVEPNTEGINPTIADTDSNTEIYKDSDEKNERSDNMRYYKTHHIKNSEILEKEGHETTSSNLRRSYSNSEDKNQKWKESAEIVEKDLDKELKAEEPKIREKRQNAKQIKYQRNNDKNATNDEVQTKEQDSFEMATTKNIFQISEKKSSTDDNLEPIKQEKGNSYDNLKFNPNGTILNGVPTYNILVDEDTESPTKKDTNVFHYEAGETKNTNPNVKVFNITASSVMGLGKAISEVIDRNTKERAEEIQKEINSAKHNKSKRQIDGINSGTNDKIVDRNAGNYYGNLQFNPDGTKVHGLPTYVYVDDKKESPPIDNSDNVVNVESKMSKNPYVKVYNVTANSVLGLGKAISKVIAKSTQERAEELRKEKEVDYDELSRIRREAIFHRNRESFYGNFKFNPDGTKANGVPTYNIVVDETKNYDPEQKLEVKKNKNPYVKVYNVSANSVLGLGKAISQVIAKSTQERAEELQRERDEENHSRNKKQIYETDDTNKYIITNPSSVLATGGYNDDSNQSYENVNMTNNNNSSEYDTSSYQPAKLPDKENMREDPYQGKNESVIEENFKNMPNKEHGQEDSYQKQTKSVIGDSFENIPQKYNFSRANVSNSELVDNSHKREEDFQSVSGSVTEYLLKKALETVISIAIEELKTKIREVTARGNGTILPFPTTERGQNFVSNMVGKLNPFLYKRHLRSKRQIHKTNDKVSDLKKANYYEGLKFNHNGTQKNGVPTYNILVDDSTEPPTIDEAFDYDKKPVEKKRGNPYVKVYNITASSVLGLGKAISKVVDESTKERAEEIQDERNAENQKRIKRHDSEIDYDYGDDDGDDDGDNDGDDDEVPKDSVAQDFKSDENIPEDRIPDVNIKDAKVQTKNNNNNYKTSKPKHGKYKVFDYKLNDNKIVRVNSENTAKLENKSHITRNTTNPYRKHDKIKKNPIKFISHIKKEDNLDANSDFKKNNRTMSKDRPYNITKSVTPSNHTVYKIISNNISNLAEGLRHAFSDKEETVKSSASFITTGNEDEQLRDKNSNGSYQHYGQLKNHPFFYTFIKIHHTDPEENIRINNEAESIRNSNMQPKSSSNIFDNINYIRKRQTTIEESEVKEGDETVREYDIYNDKGLKHALKDLLGDNFEKYASKESETPMANVKWQDFSEGGSTKFPPELKKMVVEAILENKKIQEQSVNRDKQKSTPIYSNEQEDSANMNYDYVAPDYSDTGSYDYKMYFNKKYKREADIEEYDVKEHGKTIKEYKITSEKLGDLEKALEDLLDESTEKKKAPKKHKEQIVSKKRSNHHIPKTVDDEDVQIFQINADDENMDEKLQSAMSQALGGRKKQEGPDDYVIEETDRKFYRNEDQFNQDINEVDDKNQKFYSIDGTEQFNPFRISSHRKKRKPFLSFSVSNEDSNHQIPKLTGTHSSLDHSSSSTPQTSDKQTSYDIYNPDKYPENFNSKSPAKQSDGEYGQENSDRRKPESVTDKNIKNIQQIPNMFSSETIDVFKNVKSAEFKHYLKNIDYDEIKIMTDGDDEYIYIDDDKEEGRLSERYYSQNDTLLKMNSTINQTAESVVKDFSILGSLIEYLSEFLFGWTQIKTNMDTAPFVYKYEDSADNETEENLEIELTVTNESDSSDETSTIDDFTTTENVSPQNESDEAEIGENESKETEYIKKTFYLRSEKMAGSESITADRNRNVDHHPPGEHYKQTNGTRSDGNNDKIIKNNSNNFERSSKNNSGISSRENRTDTDAHKNLKTTEPDVKIEFDIKSTPFNHNSESNKTDNERFLNISENGKGGTTENII